MDDGSGTDDLLAEARAALRLVEQARTAVTSLVGRGRSPDGSVRARVGGDGLIETVRLRPEAMQLDSAALAGQVRAAVRSAQESFARQAGDVRANVLAGVLAGPGRAPEPARLAGVLGSAGRAPDPAGLAGVRAGAGRAPEPARLAGVPGGAGRTPDPARLAARLEEVQAHFVRRMDEFGRSLDALHRRLEG